MTETVRRLAGAGLSGSPGPRAGIDISMLGPLTVRRDGELVEAGALKQRSLLALLALQPGRVVGRGEIAGALWEQGPPETWLGMVHTYVARLRATCRSRDVIATKRGGYVLAVDGDRVDVLRFETLVARGLAQRDRGDLAGAAGSLEAALALWEGPLLEDLPPALRVHPVAVAIAGRRVAAALAFTDVAGELRQSARAVAALQPLVWAEPLHEGVHAALMLALAGAGQQAAALEVFGRIRDRLAGDLGLEPGADLRVAHQRVLCQDV